MSDYTLRKLNRIVRVTENELNRYLAKGYEVLKDAPQSQQVEADKPEVTPSVVQPTEPNRIVIQSEAVTEEATAPKRRKRR